MNTQVLKYVLEVEKTGSINKAAGNLFISQPNLSKAIRELESDMGITIFQRTTRGVVPTQKGHELLGMARGILSQVEKMESLSRPDAGQIVRFDLVGPRESYATCAFADFAEKNEARKMRLHYTETHVVRAIQYVAQGDCHLGIVQFQAPHEHYYMSMLTENALDAQIVMTFGYKVIMNEKHPLAQLDEATYDNLKDYTEIAYGDEKASLFPPNPDKSDEEPVSARNEILVHERSVQFALLCSLQEAFSWSAPMPQEMLRRYHLVEKTYRPAQRIYKAFLIYKEGHEFSELDTLYINSLKETVKKLKTKAE